MNSEIIFITLVIILFYNFYNTKDTFYNVTQEEEDLYKKSCVPSKAHK
jgi:hypothetical protein